MHIFLSKPFALLNCLDQGFIRNLYHIKNLGCSLMMKDFSGMALTGYFYYSIKTLLDLLQERLLYIPFCQKEYLAGFSS